MSRVVVGSLVALLVSACGAPSVAPQGGGEIGGDDAGVPDAGPRLSARERFCRELATVQTGVEARCGSLSDAGVEQRVAWRLDGCDLPLPSRRAFDADAGAQCLAAWNSAACHDAMDVCSQVLRGTVELNGGCAENADCAHGNFCDRSSTCPGVCRAPVALGQPVPEDGQCAANAYPKNGRCVARLALDEACDLADAKTQCVDGATCGPGALCVPKRVALEGEDCGDFYGLRCAEGLACTSDGCAKKLPLGATCDGFGAPCQDDLHCIDGACLPKGVLGDVCDFFRPCGDGFACPPFGETKYCAPIRLVGDACNTTFDCDFGLACSDGRCSRLPVVGESCDGQCADGLLCSYADGPIGRCVALAPAGSTCADGSMCMSHSCIDDVCTVPATCPMR